MIHSEEEANEKLSAILSTCSDVKGFVKATYSRDATIWGVIKVHEVMAKNVVDMLVKQQLIIERLQKENQELKNLQPPDRFY